MSEAILRVENLHTHFLSERPIAAVRGVSFELAAGRVLGLVGESGSGKSVTGFSIMRLIESPGKIVEGRVLLNGSDLTRLPEEEMRQIRGASLAMIFQDPMMTLNPVMSIGAQMIESVRAHADVSKGEARRRARDALGRMGIPSPEERLDAYPHQFSGGMRQRVVIAIAMLHRPAVIIADEATTALDVTIQSQILSEVQKLCSESGTAMIWITHDLSVVAGLAHEIAVMYTGQIVEMGSVDDVLDRPVHPYTQGLISSAPSRNRRGALLNHIPGTTPSLAKLPKGCAFRPRCSRSDETCVQPPPLMGRAGRHSALCHHPLRAIA